MRFISGMLLMASLFSGGALMAQNSLYTKANKHFFEGNYEKAIPYYEKALRRGVHPISIERLADCYREVGDTKKAEVWYKKAIRAGRENSSTTLYYGRMLHANGKYEEAADQYEAYMNETRDYPTVANDFRSCKLALYLKRQPSPYAVYPVKQLNTAGSDLMGANQKEAIVFATKGKHGSLEKPQKSEKRNDQYDLVLATKKGKKGFASLEKVKGKVNTGESEFAPSFSPSGDSVCFTRTTVVKQGKNRPPLEIHRIYLAKVEKGKWKDIESVPFNGPASVSNFHPAFHPQGGWLVFASDRKGGMGGADLWKTSIKNGKWGKPENLGTELNTSGDEMWPAISSEGTLAFASDGHPGLGGLDLFTAEWNNENWGNPQNMGTGINSSKHEQALAWGEDGISGYFSSGRVFKKRDDLYAFGKLPTIDGIIRDSLTHHVQPGVKLILSDGRSDEQETETDQEGGFTFFGELGKSYVLQMEGPGFRTITRQITVDSSHLRSNHFVEFRIPPALIHQLEGTVLDSETEDPLSRARIDVIPKGGGKKRSFSANAAGQYGFRITEPGDYQLVYNREGYNPQTIDLSLSGKTGQETQTFDISLDWDRQTPVATTIPRTSGGFAPGDDPIRVNGGEFRNGNQGRTLYFAGKVYEKGRSVTGLSGARIDVMNLNTQEVYDSVFTAADGSFSLSVPRKSGADYYLVASKKGYFSSGELINSNKGDKFEVNLSMNEVAYGLDSTLVTIFYAYNNAQLDLPTQGALCELGLFMQKNPDAILEIWSFTDSRGSRSYNRKLSQRRSEAVIGYINNRLNIPRKRFNVRGFGEDQLLNDCTDGKPCSDKEHDVNRRTEIKVVN